MSAVALCSIKLCICVEGPEVKLHHQSASQLVTCGSLRQIPILISCLPEDPDNCLLSFTLLGNTDVTPENSSFMQ